MKHSPESISTNQDSRFEQDYARLQTTLLKIRSSSEAKPVEMPAVQHDDPDRIDPEFNQAIPGKNIYDPGFLRSPAEILHSDRFETEIRIFCEKYGLKTPQFTNVENALEQIRRQYKKGNPALVESAYEEKNHQKFFEAHPNFLEHILYFAFDGRTKQQIEADAGYENSWYPDHTSQKPWVPTMTLEEVVREVAENKEAFEAVEEFLSGSEEAKRDYESAQIFLNKLSRKIVRYLQDKKKK